MTDYKAKFRIGQIVQHKLFNYTGPEHQTLKFTDYAIFKSQFVFKVNGKKYYHWTNFIV